MSDIHDPAHPDSPAAPGDEGNSSQQPEPGNAPPGNEAPGAASVAHAAGGAGGDEPALQYDEDSPEDSIGNRLDRPPTHGTNLGQLAAQQGGGGGGGAGQKRRDKRDKRK